MPAIIMKSIAILSDAGLGMAMFSLGALLCSAFACMHANHGSFHSYAVEWC